jgi:hypothetical protein
VLRAILKKISPAVPKPFAPESRDREAGAPVDRKAYSRPEVRKLGTEQGILMLVGRAWTGDKGARELLELIFPEPGGMNAAASQSPQDAEQPLQGR